MSYSIKTKRIYEKPLPSDGYRILVDRLWPRGISKKTAALDQWNKEIAPSTALRKWFGHQPERIEEFTQKYKEELATKNDELDKIKALAQTQSLTLLYAAKDFKTSHVGILLEILQTQPTKEL